MSRSILRAPPRSSSTRWTMYSDKQPPAWAAKGASDCSSGNATQLCDAAPDRNVVAALRLRRAPAIPGPPPSPQTHQSPHTNSTSCRRACTANTCPSKSHVGFLASAREAAQSIEHTHSRWCQEVDDSHCQGHCRDGHRSAQGQWTMRSRARDPRWTLHAGPASPTPLPTNRATATAGVWVGGWAGDSTAASTTGYIAYLRAQSPLQRQRSRWTSHAPPHAGHRCRRTKVQPSSGQAPRPRSLPMGKFEAAAPRSPGLIAQRCWGCRRRVQQPQHPLGSRCSGHARSARGRPIRGGAGAHHEMEDEWAVGARRRPQRHQQ